jgi:hypothetical protein
MPPKKRAGREPLAANPSQTSEGQSAETTQATSHLQIASQPNPTVTETESPEEPPYQPSTQAEVLNMNTSAPTTQHPTQHQSNENQEESVQDSKEEIETVIENELARLRQKNEQCWRLPPSKVPYAR